MPLFEFRCKSCGQHFETLVIGSRTTVCPRCDSADLEKQASRFGVGGPGGDRSAGHSRPSCSTGGG
ncbi:MAG TPA: zinc ribbon domain-containing protein [Vicinamibacterales bacterium]|nr:zinc ribbon domain-containing protein [Vicinamibacterales bacterium]HOG28532.1 zinc ribbon domain-containing protein [Vicinamibacterales bacterium]HOQ61381.1 zinc ribbon domain-containing protein [Vicinamibacterales bacterium]HPK72141.1 zinc ribbon domain-containing protein [Vicinamibacterales bacterium]HPW21665.1 zinc ribbon domain-containing protein [Vicinamibacterales bacterium]